jgi:hypothetical protein
VEREERQGERQHGSGCGNSRANSALILATRKSAYLKTARIDRLKMRAHSMAASADSRLAVSLVSLRASADEASTSRTGARGLALRCEPFVWKGTEGLGATSTCPLPAPFGFTGATTARRKIRSIKIIFPAMPTRACLHTVL